MIDPNTKWRFTNVPWYKQWYYENKQRYYRIRHTFKIYLDRLTGRENKELRKIISDFNRIWYSPWTKDPAMALQLHRKLEELFNWAEIEDTLIENNPDGMTPSEFKDRFGVEE